MLIKQNDFIYTQTLVQVDLDGNYAEIDVLDFRDKPRSITQ